MTSIDKHHKLDTNPFDYQTTKDGKLLIYWHDKLVKTLKGKEAQRFLDRIEGLGVKQVQLMLAKVTGNFKRGNER